MTKQKIIDKTLEAINQLPTDKAEEISDFTDFVLKKFEEQAITNNIQKIISDSSTFSFLLEDEELYSIKDIKEQL
jgi:thiamine phosphate synthase YjbQ (UPF0047 family)